MKQVILLMLLFSLGLPESTQAQRRLDQKTIRVEKPSRLKPEQRAFIKQRQQILHEKLDLTPSQKNAWKSLRRETRSEIEKVKSNSSLNAEQKKQRLDRIILDAKEKRNSLLSPTQRAVLEKELKFRKNRKKMD